MAKTIVGLFDTVSSAQNVVQDLLDNGFRRDQISLVAQNDQTTMTDSDELHEQEVASDSAGTGAVSGTVLGGALGLLVGTGLLVIPGIGPVLAAGPLVAAIGTISAAVGATALGAGVGAATGGLAGGLMGAGVPDDDANTYAEGVRRGGTLITVQADEAMADTAAQIMKNHDVVDLKDRSLTWSNSSAANTPGRAAEHAGNDWEDSSKIGTGAGTISGAATGAAIGSVGGPVGTVVGGIAGAVAGGVTGAAGDVAGEHLEENGSDRRHTAHADPITEPLGGTRSDFARGQRDQPMTDTRSDFARGQRSFESYDQTFRGHYQQNFAGERPYDYYSPAYRYGYDMAGSNSYTGQSWANAEPELRKGWERDYPNTWAQFKHAIQHAWDNIRGER